MRHRIRTVPFSIFLALVLLAALLAMTGRASAGSSTLTPTDDTFTDRSHTTATHGADAVLQVGDTGKNTERRAHLKFTVSGIPTGATNITGTLRLWSLAANSSTYTVFDEPTSWAEAMLTWSTQPALGAQLATRAGVTVGYNDFSIGVVSNGTRAFAVRSNLACGGSPCPGGLSSKEGPSAQWPQLVVTWTDPTTTSSSTTTTTLPPPQGAHYVSRNGPPGGDGSLAAPWPELSSINWSVVQPGDTIFVDGGTTDCGSNINFYDPSDGIGQYTAPRPGVACGMEYDTTLTIGASGTASQPIHIERWTDPGHDGTVVLYGGRTRPLPYCHQTNWPSTPAGRPALVNFNGQSYITLDGKRRSGIIGYGAQQGFVFGSDASHDNLISNVELYDNGILHAVESGVGVNSDFPNFRVRGHHQTFQRMLVHDGGQDNFQSDSVASGSMHDLTWRDNWIYFKRENPLFPGYSFNEPQGSGCFAHADAIQLYSGGVQSGLTVTGNVFGPGGNQYLYPSDNVLGTEFNNQLVQGNLFAAAHSHNVINDNNISGSTYDHNTFFTMPGQGGSEIPRDGPDTLTNNIKYAGYFTTNGSGTLTASGNIWWLGDAVPGGTNVDPAFIGPLPTHTPPLFQELLDMSFTPTCGVCAGKGEQNFAHITDILTRIDSLNG
jgi:hypothetical protein